ncbi:hypothetical protein N2152v2_005981 [Parachlorella kessleri]
MSSATGDMQRIPLDSLSAQELDSMRQQLEAEAQNLMQGLLALQQSAAKFAAAGQAVEYLHEQKQGQPVLVPLTESLYVSGSLETVDSVMLEVGTGYYVERDVEGGIDFCRRKVLTLKEKIEQVAQNIQQRRAMADHAAGALQAKLSQEGRS